MDARQLDRYRWRLFHRLPLIGGWLQRRAARALAADRSVPALQVLAEALSAIPCRSAILDAELCLPGTGGGPDF